GSLYNFISAPKSNGRNVSSLPRLTGSIPFSTRAIRYSTPSLAAFASLACAHSAGVMKLIASVVTNARPNTYHTPFGLFPIALATPLHHSNFVPKWNAHLRHSTRTFPGLISFAFQ